MRKRTKVLIVFGLIFLFIKISATIINIPDRPDSSTSADGQNNGADPYRQNNPKRQSGNRENYRDAHAQQNGSIAGQPVAQSREGRLSPTVIKSEYVVYDPDHPMADQHGIVYLQVSPPGGESNYTLYDPASPRADKHGNIHLKVRNPNNSKLRSSLREQDREQYQRQIRNTKNQVLNNPNPAMRSQSDTTQNSSGLSMHRQPDMAQTAPDPARTVAGIPYRRPIVTNVNITETNDTDSGFTEPTVSSHIPSQSGMSPEKNIAERQVPGVHLQRDYNALKTSTQSVITRSPKTTPVFSSYQSPPPATGNVANSDPRQSVATTRPKTDPLASPYQSLPAATNTLKSNPGTSPAIAPRPVPDNTVPVNRVNTGRRPAAVNTIEQTIADLERYVMLHPDNMQTQMALRLIYNAYGRDDKALESLPTMSMENQAQMKALTQAILLAAKTSQAANKTNPDMANQALKALDKVCEKLAEKACLSISRLKICGEVKGFGNYKEIDKKELETGSPRRIYVYCELQNFRTKLNEQNMHVTDLHADITLFDSAYKPQLRIDKDVPDTPVHNRRRDFYLHGWLDLPKLSPGKYEIFVSIKDKIADMTAPPQRYEFEVKSR